MPPPRSDKRRFQPVKADVLGYESGKSRFTNKDGDWVPSSISPWRNNLTALSQRFNLYFVASKAKVHVYVPAFYTQSLGGSPSLVLSPPPARPNAIGYLDELHPHTINHLIVGDLGTDEVLVLATDTGNIAVYHTGAIARALESHAAKVTQTTVDDGGIRPFFTHWVLESAWGLAIHKAARLIAVSANVPHRVQSEENTAKITVFAFALTSASPEDADNDQSFYEDTGLDDAEEWLEIDDNEALHHQLSLRDRNLKITLSEHRANIPNIAFVNNHHDRQGKFLFSTDIDGEMKLWRIWDREVLRSYDFSEYNYGFRSRRGDRTDRGWNVVPLDPATFYTTSNIEEFCGEKDPSEYYPSPSGAYLGGQRESYLLNGRAGRRAFLGAQTDTDSEDEFGSDPEIEDDNREDVDDEVGGVSLSAAANQSTPDTIQVFNGEVEEVDAIDAIIDDRSEVLEEGISSRIADEIVDRILRTERRQVSLGGADLQAVLSADRFHRPGSLPIPQDDGSSTVTMTEAASETFELQEGLFGHTESQQLPSPRSEADVSMSESNWRPTRPSTTIIPPLPVLHLSGSNLRLTNAPFASLPHFFVSDPCSQYYPDAVSWMYHMERMNMMAYLPEIGLVVAASQTGKVALLTLTRRAETGCLGCRIDCVLPTEEQEKNKERPPAPLLGLAVSPIQGSSSIPNDIDHQTASEEEGEPEEEEWAIGRTIDGISQSFEQNLLDLDAVNNPQPDSTDSSTDEDYTRRYQRPASTPLQYPPPPPPPGPSPTTPKTTSSSSRRKTLSPRSHRRQVTSTPSPRQQPTPPSRSTQSSSSRPGSKKLRTNSDLAMSIPAPPRSHPKQHKDRVFPLVTTPWAKPSSSNDHTAERRTYRLMLTFYDHTVLTYEIQRCQGRIGLWGSGKSNLGNRDDGMVL